MAFEHQSVMLCEVLELFKGHGIQRFVDGTLGGAGHSSAILEALPKAELLGLDRDEAALAAARLRLAHFGERVHVMHSQYSCMLEAAHSLGWDTVDAVLLDLGVSSPQIDTPERGFSFRFDAPLDMRMDQSTGRTAAQLLNELPEKELADIFYQYGEERKSRQIARAVVAQRERAPWRGTKEFAAMVSAIVGHGQKNGLPPATRCFQALRIAVNDELGELELGLRAALELLAPGGLLVVISFHSLEDRMVKQFLAYQAATCVCPPGLPVCVCGKVKTMEVLTHKPLRPTEEEQAVNGRAACAKLRAAVKL
jgi:16S rRNA (cytosine1402-N4)-methyltransferase